MYGGLFGDLPSAKNSKSDDKRTKTEGEETAANKDTEMDADSAKAQQLSVKDEESSKKRPASMIDKLGTAGTTRAFVPAALRNRKRVNTASSVTVPKKIPSVTTKEQSKPQPQQTVSHIHTTDTTTTTIHDDSTPSEQQEQEQESEQMRLLHASVVDPYDPHVPNDLLAYWDRKAMEKERFYLERQAKETLKRQEELRRQLEQERASLEKEGNLEGIVEHRQRLQMGRGRGISNLPAWLVQKQKKQVGAAVEEDTKKPECTVILSNLIAPGHLDDDLPEEVKEECEEQCGPVTSVVTMDAKPPYQPMVQVHVEFGSRDHAEKAVRVFEGRKFGQRRITAELMRR